MTSRVGRVLALVLALALLLVLGRCASRGVTPDPADTDADLETADPDLEMWDCALAGRQARCGTLAVYEDRATMRGRMIDVFFGVLPARGPDRVTDPVFYLTGGLGGAATVDVFAAVDVLRQANDRRDIVLVDQRGTGQSNERTCPEVGTGQADELRDCLANLPSDSRAYTTAWAMDDLDDVRAALGYETINLYGDSYGATAAQVYLQRHPDRARTALLFTGTPLDVAMFEQSPRSSQGALDRLFERCAADTACHAAYPDPRGDLDAVMARLDTGPVEVPAEDSPTGEPVVFTRAGLGFGVHGILNDTQVALSLPELLRAASDDDWETVARELVVPPAGDPTWQMMALTILCHEPWASLRQGPTEDASAGSYLTYEDIRARLFPDEVCAVVPEPDPAALYDAPTTVGVPVLAINGDTDPQAPPELMASIDDTYPNSRVLVGRGQAYTSWTLSLTCLGSIVGAFIDRASVDVPASCLESATPPPFSPP